MTIGIDIDDTITNTSEEYINYVKMYFNSSDPVLINNILHGNNITHEMLDFYDKYLLEILCKVSLKENVKEVIDRLRLDGYKIILISARGYKVKSGQIRLTKNYLKKHNINVDKMIFKAKNKTSACFENNIDLLIDDSVTVLEDLKENGVNVLLFSSVSNQNIETDIQRVNNWLELEKYIVDMEHI